MKKTSATIYSAEQPSRSSRFSYPVRFSFPSRVFYPSHSAVEVASTLWLSIIFLCIFAPGTPSQARNASDKRDYEEAMRLEALGHYGEAARILREVQRHRPKDANVLVELAGAYMYNYNDISGGIEKAEECLRRAIQLDPECGKAYRRMAEIYDTRGDYVTGIKLATQAIKSKKPDPYAYKERAGALSNLKRDKEALVDYDTFLQNIPQVERTHLLQRGSILENLKQYDRALADYRKLLKEKYEDQIVYREVACLRARKKPEEALTRLNTLLTRNKNDDSGYLTRARLLESMGKHQQAITDYSKAHELQPSTTALKERAVVYEKMGRRDLAEKDRKEADRL